MTWLTILGGIAWDPQIRGILAVLTGVVVLMGSIYLLVATNTGARLGFLIAMAGFFGWMVIMTLYWWLLPPGNGPRGEAPAWVPVEVYISGDEPPETEQLQALLAAEIPSPEAVLEANPELAGEFTNSPVLSDIAAVDETVLPGRDELNGWRIMATSDAGEAQAAADAYLADSGIFGTGVADYKKLDAFEIGGKPTRTEECDDSDVVCRAWYRVRKSFMITHPEHLAVIQLQPVVEQELVPGAPPPTPVVDETKPVISVVLVRDLGSVRLLPATYFVISLALFIVFVLLLHYRDKTLQRNLEAAKAVTKAGS